MLPTRTTKSGIIYIWNKQFDGGILSSTAAILEVIKGLQFKEKKGAAFGSYGWSGESVKIISGELGKAGFEVVSDGIRELWNPDEDALNRCRNFGRLISESK